MTADPRSVAYLDHAATTPMHPRAVEVVSRELARTGNPSSLHGAGRAARRVVEESRERIAAALGAHPREVVLTAGGTEADNLAVKGIYWARHRADARRRRVLVTAVEHHAVLDPARWLAERSGAELVLLPVDAYGAVDLAALDAELTGGPDGADGIAVVSVMWANNEIGTVQPVQEVVRRAHARGVPVHVDAVQAVGRLDVDLGLLGADAVTVSAHKLGGPVGVGALVVRRDLPLEPVLHGGGQERSVRSGTVDVASVAGFAEAVEIAVADREAEAARLTVLRDALVSGVRRLVPAAVLRGPEPVPDACDADADAAVGAVPRERAPAAVPGRLPGNAHFTFPGCDGDALLYLFDSRGVQVSTGSACQAGVAQPSHVLLALGVDADDARGALRFSFGRTSVAEDVEHVLAVLPEVIDRARAAGLG